MKKSSNTQFLRKKFPLAKSVMDYLMRRVWERLEVLVATAAVSGSLVLWQHHETKKQIWGETGDHLLDAHNEIYQNRDVITLLSNRL